ncbi:MAG: hypothetical protein U1F43_02495 [Myxococcota bacterium]
MARLESTPSPSADANADGDGDALAAACERAYATLRASLGGELWDEDAGRVAHARTLVMAGRGELAHAVLESGGLACAIERMHMLHADDDWDGAIAVGRAAAARFPASACGLRNSVAGMLSALGRHAEALAELEQNIAAEPEVAAWRELRELVVARLAEDAA